MNADHAAISPVGKDRKAPVPGDLLSAYFTFQGLYIYAGAK